MTVSNEQIVNTSGLYINAINLNYIDFSKVKVFGGADIVGCRDVSNTIDIDFPEVTYFVNMTLMGAGGLDTGGPGAQANKVYAIYAICDVTGNPLRPNAFMASLNNTAPTLPYGYSNFRVVGHIA